MRPLAWQDRLVMRRVGLVLVMIGLADVAACGIAIANRVSYRSSLSVFVLIAGVMVYRGHLGAVRLVVRWFSFMLGGLVLLPIALLVISAIVPSASGSVSIGNVALRWLWGAAALALFLWIRQSLARLPVFEGNRPARPLLRMPETAVGAAIPILVTIAFVVFRTAGVVK